MKQIAFSKRTFELQIGDHIYVSGSQLDPEISEDLYLTAILKIERYDTYAYQLILEIIKDGKIVKTQPLDYHKKFQLLTLQGKAVGQESVWVSVANIEEGDIVRCWDRDAKVISVQKNEEEKLWTLILADAEGHQEEELKLNECDALLLACSYTEFKLT